MTQAALLPEPPRARATARTRVEPHRTEAELIALLTKRLTRPGNGGALGVVEGIAARLRAVVGEG